MSSSLFNNSSISISISDEDSDDLGLKRVRVRRKRKKQNYPPRTDFTRRALRFFLRNWTVLIFVFAAGLLLFEATRIGKKSNSNINSEDVEVRTRSFAINSGPTKLNKPSPEKKSETKLDRLEPVTRVIHGVRVPCLKLLPSEEIEHLGIPTNKDSKSPVKKVVYLSDNSIAYVGRNTTLSRQQIESTRFNLFTGNQTFDQRQDSFKVKETAAVHCGFYNENGGFRVSDEDKNFMQNCEVVVSTCAFGGGDDLHQPIGMTEASLQKVCYVAFWDEVTLAAQASQGNKIGDDGYIGKWRIVVVRELPFTDQRLNGKIPKMLAHRLFPNSRYSIWVDSKSQFRRDPLGVLEALLWHSNTWLAISEHGARSSVYDEAKAVVKKHKATPEEVEVQVAQYRRDGLPEDKRFNGKKGLCEASVLVREHTPISNLLMCLWFNEVVRFTSRDQLSFPYVLWRLNVFDNITAFPICTRRDLVNSIGHVRKAQPLKI